MAEFLAEHLSGDCGQSGGVVRVINAELPLKQLRHIFLCLVGDRRDDVRGLLAGELKDVLKNVKRLSVDTETTSIDPMRAKLVGISLAWRAGRGVYIPVKGPLGAAALTIEQVRDALGATLADEGVEKIGQNIKYDLIVLANAGIRRAQPARA